MTTLATRPPTTDDAITIADYWNEEQKRTIREFLVPADRNGRRVEVTDAQLVLFAQVCKLTNLDPFTGQIFLIPLDGSPKPFIGINGLRAIASRVPEGISSQVFWKSRGGEWEESWEGQGAPFAAMAVIKRGTSEHRAVVLMSEFPARGPNQSRPAHYIGTVAERHGLRKACPLELSRTLQAAASAGAIVQETRDEHLLLDAEPTNTDLDAMGAPPPEAPEDEPQDAEWGEPPSLEQLKAEYRDVSAEARRAGIGHRVPGVDAGTTEWVDAITNLREKIEAKARP